MPRRRRASRGARAQSYLHRWFEQSRPGASDESVGPLRHLGSGLSYDAWGATLRLGGRTDEVVVRLPRPDADEDLGERTRTEFALLEHLGTLDPGIRLPTPLGLLETEDGVVPIQRKVEGIQLDHRARYEGFPAPWDVVATAAATCHRLPLPPIDLPCHSTRRAHAMSVLERFEELDFPAADDAVDWASENLPPDQPASFLHGDLLGQNLRVTDHPGDVPGVIDWEFAMQGDPAYDLAIVTRGAQRVFHEPEGLERLLDAYNAIAETELTAADVRFYELALSAELYLTDLRDYGPGRPPVEATRRKFQSVLRRASRAR